MQMMAKEGQGSGTTSLRSDTLFTWIIPSLLSTPTTSSTASAIPHASRPVPHPKSMATIPGRSTSSFSTCRESQEGRSAVLCSAVLCSAVCGAVSAWVAAAGGVQLGPGWWRCRLHSVAGAVVVRPAWWCSRLPVN